MQALRPTNVGQISDNGLMLWHCNVCGKNLQYTEKIPALVAPSSSVDCEHPQVGLTYNRGLIRMPPKAPDRAARRPLEPIRVRCPHCRSSLDVLDTQSGGRNVSVFWLGPTVEMKPTALELFLPPGDRSGELVCPACSRRFDPSGPQPIPPFRR